jgi:hypothetical protein
MKLLPFHAGKGQFMAPGGLLMEENDPPSLCQAAARQARHGSSQPTFKPSWIKAVFLFTWMNLD